MSTYHAFVAEIKKVQEIPGADRIHTAFVMGEQVVVSKDWGVGMVGLFFPADTQLSEDFCKHNNLFRKSEMNIDPEKTGFFEQNRRVRCQPFMKVRSEGFFTQLSALDYLGVDVTKFKVGESFDEIGGVKICQKYVNEKTRRALSNKLANSKKMKAKEYPNFPKHVDTEQFRYHSDKIQKGDIIYFHAKAHGCFTHKARVRMWDGSHKLITQIEVGDSVVGLKDGVPVESKVLEIFNNGKTKEWVELKLARQERTKSNAFQRIECTPNHEIMLSDGSWVAAGDLTVGDTVLQTVQCHIPSKEQIGAYLGMYMGDGYFSRSGNLQFCHKLGDEDYVDYKRSCFSSLGTIKKTYRKSGYGSDTVFSMIPCNRVFWNLFSKFQPVGEKRLDESFVDMATRETLAFWYMDDGSLSHHSSQQDRAVMAICGVQDRDIHVVEKIFKKFDIDVKIYKDSQGHNRLRMNTEAAHKFWALIVDLIPPSMAYKVTESLRHLCTGTGVPQGEDGFLTEPVEVISVKKIETKRGRNRYDISTETVNYVVNNTVVHNSSQRGAYTKVIKRPETFFEKVMDFFGLFKKESYETVLGTRNVILSELSAEEKEGFHGSEKWRLDAHEKIKPFLEKGMVVYYEMKGYANGSPIMPNGDVTKLKDKRYTKKYGNSVSFAYGCKEHETKFHIYRIAFVSEDGHVQDLSDAQCRKWCEDRGLEYALEVHPPMIYDGNKEALEELVERLTERPECLTEDYWVPNQISEGIILRVERGTSVPLFLKSKSYPFRVLENIIKEQGEVDMEESS